MKTTNEQADSHFRGWLDGARGTVAQPTETEFQESYARGYQFGLNARVIAHNEAQNYYAPTEGSTTEMRRATPDETSRAMAHSNAVADFLEKAEKSGTLPKPPDGTAMVILVECLEPEVGPDACSLSVIRRNCDPCECAAICRRVVEDHVESDPADDEEPHPTH